jgi:hypothetical protein
MLKIFNQVLILLNKTIIFKMNHLIIMIIMKIKFMKIINMMKTILWINIITTINNNIKKNFNHTRKTISRIMIIYRKIKKQSISF